MLGTASKTTRTSRRSARSRESSKQLREFSSVHSDNADTDTLRSARRQRHRSGHSQSTSIGSDLQTKTSSVTKLSDIHDNDEPSGATFIQLCVVFIKFVVAASFVGVGDTHRRQCPDRPSLPLWMLVGGVYCIFDFMFSLARYYCCANFFRILVGYYQNADPIFGPFLFLFNIVANCAMLAWFVYGYYITFNSTPVLDDPKSPNFCIGTLYNLAWWSLILMVVCVVLIVLCVLVCICCFPRRYRVTLRLFGFPIWSNVPKNHSGEGSSTSNKHRRHDKHKNGDVERNMGNQAMSTSVTNTTTNSIVTPCKVQPGIDQYINNYETIEQTKIEHDVSLELTELNTAVGPSPIMEEPTTGFDNVTL